MRQGLAKIHEKVCISRYFENLETDLYIAENACWIDCTDTWSSKWVHSRTKSQCPHCGACGYGCNETLEQITGVAWVRLLIIGIHTRVAPISKIQWLPATLYSIKWMDHCEVYHGSIEAIPILDPVDVKEAYSHIASPYHSLEWHVQSYGWHYASSG